MLGGDSLWTSCDAVVRAGLLIALGTKLDLESAALQLASASATLKRNTARTDTAKALKQKQSCSPRSSQCTISEISRSGKITLSGCELRRFRE